LEQVEDFVDVVALFIEATRIYLHSVPNEVEIMDDNTGEIARLKLDYESGQVDLNNGEYSLKFGDEYFDRVILAYARTLRNWYG
jgi:hypothetical protein